MKKTIVFLLTLGLLLGLSGTCVFAHQNIDRNHNFTGFQGSANGQTPPSGWVLQNCEADVAGVYAAPRGLEMRTSTNKTLQMRLNVPSIENTVALDLSLNMRDNKLQRIIGLRQKVNNTDGSIAGAVSFNTDRSISVFGNGIKNAVFNPGEWYNVKIRYNCNTNYYEVAVIGETNSYQASGSYGGALQNVSSIYITHQYTSAPVSYVISTYVEQVHLYADNPLYNHISYDFEGFTSAADGQTAPDGFKLQNGAANTAGAYAADKGKGTSVELRCEAGKNLEIVNPLSSTMRNTFAAEFSIQFADRNLIRRVCIRDGKTGVGQNGEPFTGALAMVYFQKNGTADLLGVKVPGFTYNPGEWYRVKLVYNLNSGAAALEIRDADGKAYQAQKFLYHRLKQLTQMHFTVAGEAGVSSSTYFDDISIYETETYNPADDFFNSFNSFAGSEDGQTAPSGTYVDPNNTAAGASGMWGVPEAGRGNVLKMFSNGTKYYELRRDLVRTSSRHLIEMDIKMKDLAIKSRSLGFKGPYSGETDIGVYCPVKFISQDQEIKVGSEKIGNFELDEWYHVVMDMDIPNLKCAATVTSSGGETFSGVTDLDPNGVPAGRFEIFLEPVDINTPVSSYTYIDDLYIGSETLFSISGSMPRDADTDVDPTGSMVVEFSNYLDKSSFNGDTVKLNGAAVSEIGFIGQRGVSIKAPMEPNKHQFLEFTGVKDAFGNTFNGYLGFDTGVKRLNVGEIKFTKVIDGAVTPVEQITDGEITATVEVSANDSTPRNAMLLLAMFQADGKKLVRVEQAEVAVDGTPKPVSATIQVPAPAGYVLEAYLWNGTQTLTPMREKAELK